jgi:hypothetical protein
MILFLSTNDGSDTRINKEISTLSKQYQIIFIGIGDENNSYLKSLCSLHIIKGSRKSLFVYFRYLFLVYKLLFTKKINSIHIINEQLLFLFYPITIFKRTILDLFDSFFLKKNLTSKFFQGLQILFFITTNRVIVTDENRYSILPTAIRKKSIIIENYPYKFKEKIKKANNSELVIAYVGSLQSTRGTSLLNSLLKTSHKIKVLMIGWLYDEESKGLSKKKKVEYLGVKPQEEVSEIIANQADYLMCTYEPNNLNNINASPNKIYDAVQLETPVIINSEVKVSDFVRKQKIGYVLDSYYLVEHESLGQTLKNKKNDFIFNDEIKDKFSWENIEQKIISAHKLTS